MNSKLKYVAMLGVMVGAAALFALPALADDASTSGLSVVKTMTDLISGNTGLFVGIALALFGVYMWLIKQETWGLVVVIAGVVVTAFPGIFNGLATGLDPVVKSITGTKASVKTIEAASSGG